MKALSFTERSHFFKIKNIFKEGGGRDWKGKTACITDKKLPLSSPNLKVEERDFVRPRG